MQMQSMRTLTFLFSLLLPAAAAAQQAEARSAADRLADRLPAAEAQRVGALVDSLARLGAPAEPMVLKALEGASKRAPAARIEAAVRALGADLQRARGALGAKADVAEVAAGAQALRAGASPEAIGGIKRARGAASATVPLGVLADLVAQGVPVQQALDVVSSLASRGASDADYTVVSRGGRPTVTGAGRGAAGRAGAPGIGVGGTPPGQGGTRPGGANVPPGKPASPGRPETPGRPDNPGGRP